MTPGKLPQRSAEQQRRENERIELRHDRKGEDEKSGGERARPGTRKGRHTRGEEQAYREGKAEGGKKKGKTAEEAKGVNDGDGDAGQYYSDGKKGGEIDYHCCG